MGDPALTPFLLISRKWISAGIEMTEEMVEAALKLAQAQVDIGREEARRTEAKRKEEAERLAATKADSYGSAEHPVVYYVLRGKYVKIGTTANLRERMRDLMPDAVLAVEPGGRVLERRLHGHFARIRYSRDREYFLLTDELQEHIDAVIAKHGPPPPDLSVLDQSV
ncbi:GIY-YIG nuclease family protein [Streptomyces violaceus]|uniref:GIY-YIG nuclease family protein n=1 Tax=Streptomyces violaceus TaxID=1936 RepID=A0ABZ1NKX4_STRVL